MPFGTVAQAVMAFHISLDALTVVVRKFRSVSSLMAEGSRLEGLVDALSAEHLLRSPPFSFSYRASLGRYFTLNKKIPNTENQTQHGSVQTFAAWLRSSSMISAKQPQPLPDKVQGAQVKAKDLALQLPNGSLKDGHGKNMKKTSTRSDIATEK